MGRYALPRLEGKIVCTDDSRKSQSESLPLKLSREAYFGEDQDRRSRRFETLPRWYARDGTLTLAELLMAGCVTVRPSPASAAAGAPAPRRGVRGRGSGSVR